MTKEDGQESSFSALTDAVSNSHRIVYIQLWWHFPFALIICMSVSRQLSFSWGKRLHITQLYPLKHVVGAQLIFLEFPSIITSQNVRARGEPLRSSHFATREAETQGYADVTNLKIHHCVGAIGTQPCLLAGSQKQGRSIRSFPVPWWPKLCMIWSHLQVQESPPPFWGWLDSWCSINLLSCCYSHFPSPNKDTGLYCIYMCLLGNGVSVRDGWSLK